MRDRTNATSTTAGVLQPERLERASSLRRYPCAAALDTYVENYWTLRWSLPPGTSLLSSTLPHPSCTVSVERGSTRPGVDGDPVVLTGVITRRFDVVLHGEGWAFAAKFRPGGLAALVDGRAGSWRDATLPASIALPADAVTPLRSLDPSIPDDACREVFDDVLSTLARRVPHPDPDYLLLLDVVADMLADRTILRVAQIEQRHDIGTRRLQRLFARYVGATPKWVLARYRMHDAVSEMDAGYDGPLADLAVRHGWYDQSHFTRDFRRLVGVPPAAYVARTDRT